MQPFEEAARQRGYLRPVGVDEAGRGPLAGPVFAAACMLEKGVSLPLGLDDSKVLSASQRCQLFAALSTNPSVHWAIGIASAAEVDRLNILQASLLAMQRAVEALPIISDYLLVDGLHIPRMPGLAGEAIVKGDSRCASIAAASIIAKVLRDRYMELICGRWPHYGFSKHKGYGTAHHLGAIKIHGPCAIHRLSFAPLSLS